MRIIAGEFRSRRITAPPGNDTRPTSDRLRETLFNVLGPRLPGARFLDLYAGSGANGLEALSRGAREAVFVEQARAALGALRTNIAALGVAPRCRVEAASVPAWLRSGARQAPGSMSTGSTGFQVVFLDPPYEDAALYAETLQALGGSAAALMAADGVIVVEHRRIARGGSFVLAERYGSLIRTRELPQGDAALTFYATAPSGP